MVPGKESSSGGGHPSNRSSSSNYLQPAPVLDTGDAQNLSGVSVSADDGRTVALPLDDGQVASDDEDEDENDDGVNRNIISAERAKKWIKGSLIGAGSSGKVYLAMDESSGLLMAVKQVELPSRSGPDQERRKIILRALEREIELLKDIEHENIVQYLYSSIDNDEHLNIFMEYISGGSIKALLRNYGAFEEPLVRTFVRQILQGLDYLHARGIVHGHIKSSNVLVNNTGGVKISCDFGISKVVEDNLATLPASQASLQTSTSVFWMAPEVVKQSTHTHTHTPKSDIWSVGCLVIEMLTGEHPWAELTQMQAIFKIGSSTTPPAIPSGISSDAQDFLGGTFIIDYERRPGAGELLQHTWFLV